MTNDSNGQPPPEALSGFNPALVAQYANAYRDGDPDGLRNLQTLLDSCRRQAERAAHLSQTI